CACHDGTPFPLSSDRTLSREVIQTLPGGGSSEGMRDESKQSLLFFILHPSSLIPSELPACHRNSRCSSPRCSGGGGAVITFTGVPAWGWTGWATSGTGWAAGWAGASAGTCTNCVAAGAWGAV